MNIEVEKLLALPLAERYELAQLLWGSVEAEQDSLRITETERQLLDESLEAYRKDPDGGTPWPEVKAKLLTRL